jgi:uncharacterized protein involved in exopolysaccharide biosynthesis
MSVTDVRPEDQRIEMGALFGAVLSRWLRILILTAIALGVTFAILLFVPKLYESTAALLVEERANPAVIAPTSQSSQPSIPVEAMMSSQIELIKSRDTLMAVVDSENLRSQPEFTGIGFSPVTLFLQLIGRHPEPRSVDQTVLENLNERLSVVRERDSAVISINVRSETPELAAHIANAIAAAHVKRRTELSLADTAEAGQWLEQEIGRLRVKVQDAEAAVANYRVDKDLYTGTDNTSILDQQLTAISTQITAAQERKNAAQSRANLIRQLISSGQPLDGVQDVRDSVVIQQLSQTKATLQGELAQRSSTLLSNHPTIKALKAQIAEIEDQITGEARRVADALEAEAKIEADLEQSLRDDLTRAKLSVSTATKDTVTLEGLEREAKAQRDLLESYLLRYSDATSRTGAGSALPDVRQITVAAPSVTPASPKTALILGAVGFVALALQVGGILFGELMSGRALVERSTFRRVREADGAYEDADQYDDEPDAVGDLFDQPAAEEDDQPDGAADGDILGEGEALTAEAGDERVIASQPQSAASPLEVPPAAMAAIAAAVTREPNPPAPAEAIAPPAAAPAVPPPIPAAAAKSAAPAEQRIPPRPQYNPAPRPDPRATRPDPAIGENALELSNLSADIAIGRVRVVMLAALTGNKDAERVADSLIRDALRRGLSVCRIDGGSGRMSQELGLSDLSADLASFGDVVHRVREGLAEVPWGHQPALERRSMRPITLIEALTDIYEVVIVMTGKIGMASALPVFAGVPCRLVLVGAQHPDRATVEAAVEDAANLGFEVGQIVHPLNAESEVA